MALADQKSATVPGTAGLSLAALGVVFGDIGTSPLYTLKTVIDLAGGNPSRTVVLGVVSLIIWTLIVITTIKYVAVAMRIDNDGEGGILALMALIGVKRHRRPAIVAIGLFGAALIYGDGAITPAISVLSALEGLEVAAPTLKGGRVQFNVPEQTQNGTKIRLRGLGLPDPKGGAVGDLYAEIKVQLPVPMDERTRKWAAEQPG